MSQSDPSTPTPSHPTVQASAASAIDHLLSQYDGDRRSWGVEAGTFGDPWTTAQVLDELVQAGAATQDIKIGAATYLSDARNQNGSWTSATSDDEEASGGEVPPTCHAVLALMTVFGRDDVAVQQGLLWLEENCQEGWTTAPLNRRQRSIEAHVYSTAMALRAFIRAPRRRRRTIYMRKAIDAICSLQKPDDGWAFQPRTPSDATFTCYALHGLLDAHRTYRAFVDPEVLKRGIAYLRSQQNPDGSWADWHGLSESPEATAYAVFILLLSETPSSDPAVRRGISWLCVAQRQDGGWLGPDSEDASCNWVTVNVHMALRSWLAKEDVKPLVGAAKPAKTRSRLPTPGPFNGMYDRSHSTRLPNVPVTRQLDHTMDGAIHAYVSQKVPIDLVNEVVRLQTKVELHSIYPPHFEQVCAFRGWTIEEEIPGFSKPPSKVLNSVRPRFFWVTRGGSRRLIVVCTPGEDYLEHYTLMVRQALSDKTANWAQFLSIYRYPLAERQITGWTGLKDLGLSQEDVVLIGHVEEVDAALSSNPAYRAIDHMANDYYRAWRVQFGPRRIAFLGVKYSFWGSISGHIASTLCDLGCAEILYVGKLGTLSKPSDIYERIFCPSKFTRLRHSKADHEINPPPNRLLMFDRSLDTGMHVSVPTVVEEDYAQRQTATALKASSIDNEIAVIAQAVSDWNRDEGGNVSFSCLHFATDYIRRPEEVTMATDHDLGQDKTDKARQRKAAVLRRISLDHIAPYLLT